MYYEYSSNPSWISSNNTTVYLLPWVSCRETTSYLCHYTHSLGQDQNMCFCHYVPHNELQWARPILAIISAVLKSIVVIFYLTSVYMFVCDDMPEFLLGHSPFFYPYLSSKRFYRSTFHKICPFLVRCL